MMGKDIKVIVAAHKKYEMPKDKMYVPVQVGAEGKKDIGYTKDNTGDNISSKNSMYCELTGLYWAWKNLDADYIGLAHYRRHFKGKKKSDNIMDNILSYEEASNLLDKCDVIVPKKRNYMIETIYSHYEHTHHIETLDCTREVIAELYPEYLATFDANMKKTYMHAFNMFIMSRENVNNYCKWLFDILFILEENFKNKYTIEKYSRLYGFISEHIFIIWLAVNKIKCIEKPIVMYNKNVNAIWHYE